jgi:hypothetical protein
VVEIEGIVPEALLQSPLAELKELVFVDKPIAFRVGSADVLGQFALKEDRIVIELAQIDGGGEGVLPILWKLAPELARKCNVDTVEWIVHAIKCAKPNLKLRRVMTKMGFAIEPVPGKGEAYHLLLAVKDELG